MTGVAVDPMVWVNTRTGVFHEEGSPFYRNTTEGLLMARADAEAAGHRQAGSPRDLSDRPPGSGVYSVERHVGADPRIVIQAWLGPSHRRAGMERLLPSAAEYAIEELEGYERAHSMGPGFGAESGEAIRLAPRIVNQWLQNRGVERFIRDFVATHPDANLHLKTVTRTHPGTLRLKEIEYVFAVGRADGGLDVLFRAAIQVTLNGRARGGVASAGSDDYEWTPWQS